MSMLIRLISTVVLMGALVIGAHLALIYAQPASMLILSTIVGLLVVGNWLPSGRGLYVTGAGLLLMVGKLVWLSIQIFQLKREITRAREARIDDIEKLLRRLIELSR